MPADGSDTSSYVDSIPAANHQTKKENIKNSFLCDEVSEDDDGECDDDSDKDNCESNDDDLFHSNQEESSEAANKDDNTVIEAIILKTSINVPNDSEISNNGNTCLNNKVNMISLNFRTSLVSDIEVASTNINIRKSIVINDQTCQSKFIHNITVLFSY